MESIKSLLHKLIFAWECQDLESSNGHDPAHICRSQAHIKVRSIVSYQPVHDDDNPTIFTYSLTTDTPFAVKCAKEWSKVFVVLF